MIRILGSVFSISFQTELLIMTLLGLANSTLDWKPFELASKLSVIDELHFPARSDGDISGNFISWIKKLLTLTVVVQFLCGLLNPLAYLLKLYPIITWSRADVLLPWLAIHALNTILPKVMSVVLAFVFYYESMISTVALLEFLLVETINLLVAWCNWYLFFDFYMDLRAIEKERLTNTSKKLRSSPRESVKSSCKHSSSIPNLKQESCESSGELRAMRSLGSLTENSTARVSLSTLTSDEDLTPAERTIKILSLTDEELQSARVLKGSLNKVLSNADTVDVKLIDLAAPDEISYVSVASTDESVIIVYDSQDEKELERILSPVGDRKREQEALETCKIESNPDIVDEDLLLELLEVENLPGKGASIDLPREEQPLVEANRRTEEQSHRKTGSLRKEEVPDVLEKKRLSDIKESNLQSTRKSDSLRKEALPHVLEEKRLSEIKKSNLPSTRKSDSLRKEAVPDVLEKKRLSEIKKSNLLEEDKSLEMKKRHSSRAKELLEDKSLEKPFKIQRPNLPRKDDEENFRECVCSSTEDDDDEEDEAPANARPVNFLRDLPDKIGTIKGDDFKPKEQYYAERKKTKNKSIQSLDYPEMPLNTLLLSPSTALTPRGSTKYVNGEEKDLNCLLNENFQILDKMCRAMNFDNNQSIPNNSLRKWLVFRHQLETSLDQKSLLKKNGSVIQLLKPRPIGYFNVKDKITQTEMMLKAKKRHREKRGTLLHYPKTEVIESKWNYIENFPGTSTDVIGKRFPSHQVDKSVDPSKIIDASDEKLFHSANVENFSKTTSTPLVEKKATKILECPMISDDREQITVSIVKQKTPIKSFELDCSNEQKDKDLRNLQAYNKLTLEQDKRELMQKKKKSKMTSYKNAVTELTLRNSEVVPNRPVKVDNRTCKSNNSRVRKTAHSPESKNRNFKQLFRYNEKILDQPAETQELSKNPGYKYLENESCKDKTTPSEENKALSICHSDRKIPLEGHPVRNKEEDLGHIDWLDPSINSTSPSKSSSPQVGLSSDTDGTRQTVIVDDETVSALKCAFSFSDESDRGFQLGPEMREPYPIFQVVAVTMAEIFKATGWRNFEESAPEDSEIASVADVIFCEAGLDCDVDGEVVNVLDELIKAGEEELERRKCLSFSLLEQLQDLLKSSTATLSDDRLADGDILNDLSVKDDNVGDDDKPSSKNEQIILNSMLVKNSMNPNSELPAETTLQGTRNSLSSSTPRKNRESARTAVNSHRNRIHDTKFENKLQKHHCKKGDGLSSGNVTEFDSEGRSLNLVNCPSNEAISEPEEESDDDLIKTFNSFCDKIMESDTGDDELEKKLKILAQSEKFSKLMSLFEEAELNVFREKILNEEDELLLSTSDLGSCETVLEAFVESDKKEERISTDAKKENSAKVQNQEYDIVNGFAKNNLNLPSADVGMPYTQKLKKHRKYLESHDIKQQVLNWSNESADGANSLDRPKKRKIGDTYSFSDNSDVEEFSVT